MITIRAADLDDARVAALLETHTRTARAETGAGSAHALDLDALRATGLTVWAAWIGDRVVGVGALRTLGDGAAEIKAMHTVAEARRAGVGRAVLAHILAEARRRGLARLYLETGSWPYFEPARALYAAHGFVECAPFADYCVDPNSVFMTLDLAPRSG